ncbi:hypothetical protein ABH905_004421 [Pseudomonas frederiksbergensis]|uniref:DUF3237 family protein n=1 Tax=Pseudomonas frederiksbergensis TaxID=104087 RepID=UPI003D22D0EC
MAEPLDLMGAAPNLQRVLTLCVDIGHGLMLGESEDGMRCNYSILGGDFQGLDFNGQVLAGGEDFFLVRPVHYPNASQVVIRCYRFY